MKDRNGNKISCVMGVSRKRTQIERKATVKKWRNSTKGC